jgi:hypothetical protein
MSEGRVAAALAEAVDDPVEVPFLPVGKLQFDAGRPADRLGKVGRPLARGDQVQFKLERPRDRLAAAEAGQQDGVGPQGGGDAEWSIRLRIGGHNKKLSGRVDRFSRGAGPG